MQQTSSQKVQVPFTERLKSIPGFFGIRLAEEPKYTVLEMEDEKEIRLYEKMTLATLTVSGSYESAMKEGFKRLAQYIFGENATSEEMSMTTPIFEEANGNMLTMSFILPRGINVATAPTPLDHSITVSEKPAHKAAVIWYTGGNDQQKVHEKANELYKWVHSKVRINAVGPLKIAQYDAPISLPFFRRNELQVEIAETH